MLVRSKCQDKIEKLEIYIILFVGYNGRSVYKHSTQDYQLFFKDWGSNQVSFLYFFIIYI